MSCDSGLGKKKEYSEMYIQDARCDRYDILEDCGCLEYG